MGINVISKKNSRSKKTEAQQVTAAHNAKPSSRPIVVEDTVDEDGCPEGVDKEICCPELVEATEEGSAEVKDIDITPVEEDGEESPEEKLRYSISTLTKAGLIEYALDNFDYELDGTKVKKELIEEIIQLAK